jgi:membrane protease YdiL (CAAX protease family)
MSLSAIQSALMKAGLAAGALAILSFRMHTSNKGPEWFGLRRPALLASIGFLAVYLAWMLGTDAAIHWRGPWDFQPWRQAPIAASLLRILAVCILGPTVEELLFRGVLFSWLEERLPIIAVIGLTAVSWALLHWTYSWMVIGVIVIDGILLGMTRWKTNSVLTPILMHMAYNFYAIW